MSNEKKYHNKEFFKRLPKPTYVTSGVPPGYCDRLPGVITRCISGYRCWECEYADRSRINYRYDPPPYSVIGKESVYSDCYKYKYNYFGKIVALKPEILEQLEYRPLFYYQLFKCTDGPGCLPGNDVWEVDGYMIAYPDVQLTLKRRDILGIPTLEALKKYDKRFFTNTVRESGYYSGKGGDVYDCGRSTPNDSDVSTQIKIKF